MEVSGLKGLQYDEEKALNILLDAFGSVFSLKDIASAYCEAGRNADLAGEILYEMKRSTSSAPKEECRPVSAPSDDKTSNSFGNKSQTYQGNGGFTAPKRPVSASSDASSGDAKNDEPSESSCSNNLLSSCEANGDLRAPKQKRQPILGGTVSCMLGKGYMKSVPLARVSCPGTKPFKVDSGELPVSELWGEGLKSTPLKEDRLHKDMEDFLFKMLGEGFQLDRDVIRDVLDSCGYDMQKTMDKLLDRSALKVDKEKKFLGESSEKTSHMHPNTEGPSQEKNRVLSANGGELTRLQKDRNDLQMDVLAALFKGPEKFDELPTRKTGITKRPIALGKVVEGPLIDLSAEQKADEVRSKEVENDDGDEEDSFQALRRAVKEYRGIMKEYYKNAVDAFAKGDQDQANRLLEQGQFFREKARLADEESNQKIFETRNKDTEDVMQLKLHIHDAREAIRLLKSHLSLLAGIRSFKYLKLILETSEEDSSKGRRRRLVMKLLEKESISWSEGQTPGVVMIPLDNINRKRLSFAQK